MITHLNQEARLVEVRDVLAVNCGEVLGDLRGHIVVNELVHHWSLLEVNVVDTVGPLVAPVSDDRLALELLPDTLLPHLRILCSLLKFDDAVEASLS